MTGISRRELIKGVAAAGAATYVSGGAFGRAMAIGGARFADFTAIAPSSLDELQVPDGYVADVLIRWGDEFGDGLVFGYNCDYTTYFPRTPSEGLLWVNHEYVIPWFVSDWRSSMDASWDPRVEPYASLMAVEKDAVGGSIVHIRRDRGQTPGRWRVVEGSPRNRRFTGDGPLVPYDGPAAGSGLIPAEGSLGTLANCSGAQTPWGTILTAEENYQSYGLKRFMPFNLGWDNAGDPNYYTGEVQPQLPGPNSQNAYGEVAVEVPNYGYIVEIEPLTGEAVKHTALGRIHHENVAMRIAGRGDHRVVAYTGDDAPNADGMLFRFVSSRRWSTGFGALERMGLLGDGQLYVAQFIEGANHGTLTSGTGRWHALDMSPESCAFTTKWVRDNIIPAVGGTTAQFHVPRCEDCEILPGRPTDVIMALTSRRLAADPTAYGCLRVLREASEDPDNLDFTWFDVLPGGPASGVANHDNLAFSAAKDMWLTSDISNSQINPNGSNFVFHGNNALFYVPLTGPNAFMAFRFANAPVRAELTGPTFVGDDTLFLSVQHPGEPRSGAELDLVLHPDNYRSWWPDGYPNKPKPSVVVIQKE